MMEPSLFCLPISFHIKHKCFKYDANSTRNKSRSNNWNCIPISKYTVFRWISVPFFILFGHRTWINLKCSSIITYCLHKNFILLQHNLTLTSVDNEKPIWINEYASTDDAWIEWSPQAQIIRVEKKNTSSTAFALPKQLISMLWFHLNQPWIS